MFYDTPGDEIPFDFRSFKEISYAHAKKTERFFYIQVFESNVSGWTYGKDKAHLFRIIKPINEFGNVEFADENGVRLLIKESSIESGFVRFYKSS